MAAATPAGTRPAIQECEACHAHYDPSTQEQTEFLCRETFCDDCQKRLEEYEYPVQFSYLFCRDVHASTFLIGGIFKAICRRVIDANRALWERITQQQRKYLLEVIIFDPITKRLHDMYFNDFGLDLLRRLSTIFLHKLREKKYQPDEIPYPEIIVAASQEIFRTIDKLADEIGRPYVLRALSAVMRYSNRE